MKLFFAFLLIFSLGCDKKGPDVILDVNVYIHYKNVSGVELFANGTNGYIFNDIRLYYNKNNERIMVNAARPGFIPDYPYGYGVDSSTQKKYVIIFSNNNVVNDTAITLIDLKPGVEDTLKCSFIHPNSNYYTLVCDKVWYNGKLVSRSFDVVK